MFVTIKVINKNSRNIVTESSLYIKQNLRHLMLVFEYNLPKKRSQTISETEAMYIRDLFEKNQALIFKNYKKISPS